MKSFVDKYRPQRWEDIPQPVAMVKGLIERKEHILIHGPPGVGKTTAVHLLGKFLSYEVIEFNASDVRNKEQVETIIKNAATQQSLFGTKKIILIDEVDGLSGQEDRGGAAALVRVLEIAAHPIVMTANDITEEKIKDLKKKANVIEFKRVKTDELANLLRKACHDEGVQVEENILKKMAVNADGDIRAALNDLQISIIQKRIVLEGMESRESENDILQVLTLIFKTKGFSCSRAMERLNIDLDEHMLWLDENIPYEYTKVEDQARAYELLAKADVFKGRIRRWQYWRFLVYQSLFLSAGISLAKEEPYKTYIAYKRTMRLLRIWQLNMKHAKRKSIAEKIAKNTHMSVKAVLKNFHMYKTFLAGEAIIKELELDVEEVNYILGR